VQLLIAVINEEEKLDEILSGMVELGITGATIISSEGMGRVLSHDIPIFAGLETIASRFPGRRTRRSSASSARTRRSRGY
jgi:nitrogen regulatory protein P-II 1